MKSHIKKGFRKRNERMLENYRMRFSKFIHMMMFWRHYIISYYRIREERYYEQLYKQKTRRPKKADPQLSARRTTTLGDTLILTNEVKPNKDGNSAIPIEDDFSTININFFTEELFFYLMEVMHATAAMAYT